MTDKVKEALERAKRWISNELMEQGCPQDRVDNPPKGSHLDAINEALSHLSSLSEDVPVAWPGELTKTCDCENCYCGNVDDARSSGYVDGWNECLASCKAAHPLPSTNPVGEAQQEKDAERLRAALIEVRHALQFANDTPNGPINDTIWMMHSPETLFDFIDAAIAAKEPKQ